MEPRRAANERPGQQALGGEQIPARIPEYVAILPPDLARALANPRRGIRIGNGRMIIPVSGQVYKTNPYQHLDFSTELKLGIVTASAVADGTREERYPAGKIICNSIRFHQRCRLCETFELRGALFQDVSISGTLTRHVVGSIDHYYTDGISVPAELHAEIGEPLDGICTHAIRCTSLDLTTFVFGALDCFCKAYQKVCLNPSHLHPNAVDMTAAPTERHEWLIAESALNGMIIRVQWASFNAGRVATLLYNRHKCPGDISRDAFMNRITRSYVSCLCRELYPLAPVIPSTGRSIVPICVLWAAVRQHIASVGTFARSYVGHRDGDEWMLKGPMIIDTNSGMLIYGNKKPWFSLSALTHPLVVGLLYNRVLDPQLYTRATTILPWLRDSHQHVEALAAIIGEEEWTLSMDLAKQYFLDNLLIFHNACGSHLPEYSTQQLSEFPLFHLERACAELAGDILKRLRAIENGGQSSHVLQNTFVIFESFADLRDRRCAGSSYRGPAIWQRWLDEQKGRVIRILDEGPDPLACFKLALQIPELTPIPQRELNPEPTTTTPPEPGVATSVPSRKNT